MKIKSFEKQLSAAFLACAKGTSCLLLCFIALAFIVNSFALQLRAHPSLSRASVPLCLSRVRRGHTRTVHPRCGAL